MNNSTSNIFQYMFLIKRYHQGSQEFLAYKTGMTILTISPEYIAGLDVKASPVAPG